MNYRLVVKWTEQEWRDRMQFGRNFCLQRPLVVSPYKAPHFWKEEVHVEDLDLTWFGSITEPLAFPSWQKIDSYQPITQPLPRRRISHARYFFELARTRRGKHLPENLAIISRRVLRLRNPCGSSCRIRKSPWPGQNRDDLCRPKLLSFTRSSQGQKSPYQCRQRSNEKLLRSCTWEQRR